MITRKSAATIKREKIRGEYWPQERDIWTGENEKGWFRAPRTTPLILMLLSLKEISGKSDPTRVYLELLARHRDCGIVEIVSEQDHAYEAGYSGTRGLRTWQERMHILEENGFIKTKKIGNHQFRYVLLVHPGYAVEQLRAAGKVPDDWYDAYKNRRIDAGERSYKDRQKSEQPKSSKVVPIRKNINAASQPRRGASQRRTS